jgi:hypothetical protein
VKGCEARQRFGIVAGEVHEHADPAHGLGLLRPRRKRPRCRHTSMSVMNSRRLSR